MYRYMIIDLTLPSFYVLSSLFIASTARLWQRQALEVPLPLLPLPHRELTQLLGLSEAEHALPARRRGLLGQQQHGDLRAQGVQHHVGQRGRAVAHAQRLLRLPGPQRLAELHGAVLPERRAGRLQGYIGVDIGVDMDIYMR